MRRREYYWSLFHRPAKNQLDDLRTDQIEAVYAAVPKARHNEYLIWKEGFASWKPFSDFPDILISLRTAPQKHEPAPVPVVESSLGNTKGKAAGSPKETQTASNVSRLSVPESASIHLGGQKSSKSKSAHESGSTRKQASAAPGSPSAASGSTTGAATGSASSAAGSGSDSGGSKKVANDEKSVTREAIVSDGKVIILGGNVQRGGAADPGTFSGTNEETNFTHLSGANLQTSSNIDFKPKDVSKIGDVAITSDDDLSGVFLSLDTTTHAEDRGNGRYTRRLPVRIVAGDILIETKTIDVSSNGLKIEDMLPENLPRYFNVELQTYKGALSMVCSAVKMDGGASNRLKIEINDFPEILQALLIAG